MNAKGLAGAALGLSAATEGISASSRRDLNVAARAALWTIHILSVILVATRSPRIPIPSRLRQIGLLIATAGGALALYSALGEHTREGRGGSTGAATYPPASALLSFEEDAIAALDEPPSDGTYRASRHPALLGYAGFILGLALFTRSLRLFWAAPLWIAAAVGNAAIREETLRRSYPWYAGYAQDTPMLIPTGESARAALDDLRDRFGAGAGESTSYAAAIDIDADELI